jgi:hypothetical protein
MIVVLHLMKTKSLQENGCQLVSERNAGEICQMISANGKCIQGSTVAEKDKLLVRATNACL